MKKFGITVTAFFLLLGALALASAPPAFTNNTVLANRIGPSGGELFIANGDGSGEHKLDSGGSMDYDSRCFPPMANGSYLRPSATALRIFTESTQTVPDSSS